MKAALLSAITLTTLFAAAALAASGWLVAPVGRQLAYLANCHSMWDVYLLDVERGLSLNLTRSLVNENAFVWSPDGRQLGFLFYTGPLQHIYTLELPGGRPRATTPDAAAWLNGLAEPSPVRGDWTRDRTRRIYELADELYIMDHGISRKLTENAVTDASPNWSPDEREIAFASSRDGSLDIYVMDADGTNVRRVTHDESRDTSPDWSPDGRYIAYTSQRDGSADLYLIQVDGSGLRQLTVNDCWDDRAAWRPS